MTTNTDYGRVWSLGRDSRFVWCDRVVQVDRLEQIPRSRRPAVWITCHEVIDRTPHRLHYYEDENVSPNDSSVTP